MPDAWSVLLAVFSSDDEFLSRAAEFLSTVVEVWSTFCRNRSNAADALRSVAIISK